MNIDVERTRMENMDQVCRISNRPGMVEMFASWIVVGLRVALVDLMRIPEAGNIQFLDFLLTVADSAEQQTSK